MNDVIQAVGPHKDKHGERCEVKHIDQGIAFGFDSDGDPAWWKCDTGNWQGAGDNYSLHITGPWIEPPTVDVGEGWRLLEEGEMPQEGDECRWRENTNDPWQSALNWKRGNPQSAHCIYRRRVPKPFRISEHGPGVYLCRDGREYEVIPLPHGTEFTWWTRKHAESWRDDGTWSLAHGEKCPDKDLVRYLRPLPQPEWTPTDQYQQTTIVDGCEWTSRWYGKPPSAARIEQRWTRGTESEWRPVPTTTEGT
jgi:hypothetical protein